MIGPVADAVNATAKAEFEAIRRNKVYEQVAQQLQQIIPDRMKPGDICPRSGNWQRASASAAALSATPFARSS